MFTLALAAALAATPAPDIVFDPTPPVVLVFDIEKDTPVVCAKQFLINMQRVEAGETPRFDLVIAYAATMKMTPEQVMTFGNYCSAFSQGAAFGYVLNAIEVEEVVEFNAEPKLKSAMLP